MGIKDTLGTHGKAQFLEVIEWLDDSHDIIVRRYPVHENAITDKSKLVVREGQVAIFVSEGALSEVFEPGTFTLDTQNKPIVTFFKSLPYKLNYPYKGDILFVNTTLFRENRWGTPNPFLLRDPDFGGARVRAFGTYDFQVSDPAVFLKHIVGTDGRFATDEITDDLKKKLVGSFVAAVGASGIAVLDLATQYVTMGGTICEQFNPEFQASYGITLTNFTIENISLPKEVEEALDTRAKLNTLGNLDDYTKLKAADAIETAAANEGLGGAGIGLGVGLGMGATVGKSVGQALSGQAIPPTPPAAGTYHYHGASGDGQKTIPEIVALIQTDPAGKHYAWQAGFDAWKTPAEVPALAAALPPPPPPGSTPPPPPED